MPRDSWRRKGRKRQVRSRLPARFELMAETDETPAMQNPEKDPEDWTTGDEPMTGPQRSYLQTLCREAKEEFDENLTKAEASKRIDELQTKTGRGKNN
jgi:DUF3072 family protein